MFIMTFSFSSSFLGQQQPSKRSKDKDRKKKRPKNSPPSPSKPIIPEGQTTDTAIPGTSTTGELVVNNTSADGSPCTHMVLSEPGETSQGNQSFTNATIAQPNEHENEFTLLIRCATPSPGPASVHPEPVITPAPPVTDEYALVKHYSDLQGDLGPNKTPTPKSVKSKSDKNTTQHEDGFCCVMSMFDGVVLFTSQTITESLGFPRDMWLGRSFIDFVHPKDRHTFASQISSGVPFVENKSSICLAKDTKNYLYVMLRKYRGLKNFGYGIAGNDVIYEPYKLVLNFREGPDAKKDEANSAATGDRRKQPFTSTMLLIISATPVTYFYKRKLKRCKLYGPQGKNPFPSPDPDEIFNRSPRFAIRHNCTGLITHVDSTIVSAFGYLPQEMIGRSIFEFFHPEDFGIMKEIYEKIVEIAKTAGASFCGSPYRFQIQNGCYVTLDTEWACFISPWSRQLEFIIGHNRVLKGPGQIKIFQPGMENIQFSEALLKSASKIREQIIQKLTEPIFKEGHSSKHQASKKCQASASFMETLMEEVNRAELKLEMPPDTDMTISERDSVMLGEISPHHEYYDSKSSSETPPSYNQLNYSENLNRFFESKPEEAIQMDTDQNAASSGQAGEDSTGSGGSVSVTAVAVPINAPTDHDRHTESPRQRFGSCGTGSAGNFSSGSNLFSGSTTNTSNTGTSSGSYQLPALTEALLSKHNDDMEKMLLKRHRDIRATSRSEKNKNKSHDTSGKAQVTLQVPISGPDPQGTKRSGSHSWEGMENYHRTSKHQHMNEDNGNVPTTSQDTGNARPPPTNFMTVSPMMQPVSIARSPFTQQSASSLMRNIELWPPLSASLTSMRTTSMAVQAPNPYHANPSIYRTMYYIPQPQQANNRSEPPGPPPPPPAFQYMAGFMLPHAPVFGQQFLYHPMYYQPVVPMATEQPPQPHLQPVQRSSIEMPASLFMNSTEYMVRINRFRV